MSHPTAAPDECSHSEVSSLKSEVWLCLPVVSPAWKVNTFCMSCGLPRGFCCVHEAGLSQLPLPALHSWPALEASSSHSSGRGCSENPRLLALTQGSWAVVRPGPALPQVVRPGPELPQVAFATCQSNDLFPCTGGCVKQLCAALEREAWVSPMFI